MSNKRQRLTIFADHVIQYQAPLYAELSRSSELLVHVSFFSYAGAEPYHDPLFDRTVKWDLDLLSGYQYSLAPKGWLAWIRYVLSRIRRSDVVVMYGHHDPRMLLVALLSMFLGTPYLVRGDARVEGASTGLRRHVRTGVIKFLVRHSAGGLAIGSQNARFYSHFGCKRVFRAPYSIDTRRFEDAAKAAARERPVSLASRGLDPQLPTLVFAGKLIAVKRPLDVCAAVEQMQHAVNLLVLGDGPLLRAMRAACGTPRVHFEGFVNQTAMPVMLGLGDILVLPSSFEPWGLIVNEALAVGLFPVVSDSVGCAPDLVEGLGEVFPTGDVRELAKALDRAVSLLSRPEWRREAAIRNAAYSISSTAEGFIQATRAACQTPG